MQTQVQKWGNSLALRIPKLMAQEAGLERNARVELVLEDGRLIITPLSEPERALDVLLAQVTEDNLHGEVDTGPAVGHESW